MCNNKGTFSSFRFKRKTATKKVICILLVAVMLMISAQVLAGAGSASAADITYTNTRLGFSLTLPASWVGKYRVADFSVAAAFHNIKNEEAGYGGFLFDIMVSETTESLEWGYKVLAKSGDLYYLTGSPSDVQFDYNNAALTAEYNAMQKDIAAILKTFTLLSNTQPKEITVFVNGKAVVFDQPPIAENGRTLVPMRAIFEALGASVDWDQKTQTITSKRGDITIVLTLGSNIMTVNGDVKELDVPAKAVGGRTLVPIRAISESLGSSVKWDQETRTVTIVDSYKPPFTEAQAKRMLIDSVVKRFSDYRVTEDLIKTEGEITLVAKSDKLYEGDSIYCFEIYVYRLVFNRALVFADGYVLYDDGSAYNSFKSYFNVDISF